MPQDEVVAHNRAAWDRQVAAGDEWTVGASPETVAAAKAGDLSGVVLIGHKPVPRQWLPVSLQGVDVLCLASGGGQQGPQFAAAGANVTVFDNSPGQLERDRQVAAREGLTTRTVLGDMRDLSDFADACFDLILNPVSNVYCPELEPVWRECFRVLRPGGALLAGFMNPDIYIFDGDALDERDELVVRHSLPYSDTESLTPEKLEQRSEWPLEFSHTMTEQIGGQLVAGFVITSFDETPHHRNATAKYMPGYFATRALKPA
ncbi:MAG: class I SAM-dependent methyltransferase [Dehalococcoidia bacterium]